MSFSDFSTSVHTDLHDETVYQNIFGALFCSCVSGLVMGDTRRKDGMVKLSCILSVPALQDLVRSLKQVNSFNVGREIMTIIRVIKRG